MRYKVTPDSSRISALNLNIEIWAGNETCQPESPVNNSQLQEIANAIGAAPSTIKRRQDNLTAAAFRKDAANNYGASFHCVAELISVAHTYTITTI